MEKMPKLADVGRYRRQVVQFRGLNRTQGCADGEFSDMENLACLHYPSAGTRKGRVAVAAYSNPSDLFEWDGHLLVVDGTVLYYDGAALCNIEPGVKQFAVVNTKMIVWPDAIEIDLTNGTWDRMDGRTETAPGTAVFSGQTLTAEVKPVFRENIAMSPRVSGAVDSWCPLFYSYGQDASALSWTEQSGWTLPSGTLKGFTWGGTYNGVEYAKGEAGDIFIPKVTGSGSSLTFSIPAGSARPSSEVTLPDTSEYNPYGYYGVYRSWGGETSVYDGSASWVIADIYRYGVANPLFSATLRAGDRVTISGADNAENNVQTARIESIDDAQNTVTFSGVTFTAESTAGVITIQRDIPPFAYICARGNRLYGVSNSTANKVYNSELGEIESFTSRCIYVSALGLPDRFWDFSGTDADSYQVPVASNGDFTGIVSYGGDTIVWKEDMMYKLYGEYPSNFGLYAYNVAGVQNGSHRSQRIINEVLYYKGRDGVYAYTGSTPQLISYPLGYRRYTDASAGADGIHYHISMRDEDGQYDLYTYDTVHGLWMREDASEVRAFSLQGGTLYAIIGNGLYAMETDRYETDGSTSTAAPVDWYAVFPACTEETFSHKDYKRLFLRLELGEGWEEDGAQMLPSVKVETAADGGAYRTHRTIQGTGMRVVEVPLPLSRADRVTVRLSGRGACRLCSFAREYIEGSETH